MPFAQRRLPIREEAMRRDQVQRVLGPRQGDIEQSTLFLVSAVVPVPRSDGMQLSTTLRTNTDSHSWPMAEWTVERIR
jgi:hypothetical protein